jgi:hypothetical protein
MCPLIPRLPVDDIRVTGKTLKMVGIDILKRNAFNTLIEYKVKQGNVAWTVEPGPHGVWGPMVEHIDGKYTGTSRNAGYVSPSEWIENDYKVFLGHKIENDWGLVNATSWDKTTVVIDYQSYQKGHFIMTWQLPQVEPTELEVEPTELKAHHGKCARAHEECDPGGSGFKKIECCPGSSCARQIPAGEGGTYICVHDNQRPLPTPEPNSSPTPEPTPWPTHDPNACDFETCSFCQDIDIKGSSATQCVGGQCIHCHDPKNTATCEHPPPGPPPVYPSQTNCLAEHYWPAPPSPAPPGECARKHYECDPGGSGFKKIECCAGSKCYRQVPAGEGGTYICL